MKNILKKPLSRLLMLMALTAFGKNAYCQYTIGIVDNPTLLKNFAYDAAFMKTLASDPQVAQLFSLVPGQTTVLVQGKITNSRSADNGDLLDPLSSELTMGGTFMPFANGDINSTASKVATISTVLNLGYRFRFNPGIKPCDHFTISFRVFSMNADLLVDWRSVDVYFNRHLSEPSQLFLPDIMIRDKGSSFPEPNMPNSNQDIGEEPWNPEWWWYDYRYVTRSSDIWNRTDKHKFETHENPQNSVKTPKTPNVMWVNVTNRSCTTTAAASVRMYWTIARLFEPWAADWQNYTNLNSTNNYINYTNPGTGTIYKAPLGNEITITDMYDYESNSQPVSVISLPPASSTSTWNETSQKWIVPDPKWYTQASSLPIQIRDQNVVICLLARLLESWKPNDGYPFHPLESANTELVEYVYKNNNAATRNTLLFPSVNGYKRLSPTTGNPGSGGGLIGICPPAPVNGVIPPVNIGLLNLDTMMSRPVFTNNGQVMLYLDLPLWQKWVLGGMQCTNVQVVAPQIIKVTNNDYAVLKNIQLAEGDLHWMGVEAEYYAGTPPAVDYQYRFSVGAMNPQYMGEGGKRMIGTPTHFETWVLHTPRIAPPDDWENDSPPASMVGLSEKEESLSSLNIYPNPADESVSIFIQADIEETTEILIYNMNGEKISSSTIRISNGDNLIPVDISKLAPGNYLIRMNVGARNLQSTINVK